MTNVDVAIVLIIGLACKVLKATTTTTKYICVKSDCNHIWIFIMSVYMHVLVRIVDLQWHYISVTLHTDLQISAIIGNLLDICLGFIADDLRTLLKEHMLSLGKAAICYWHILEALWRLLWRFAFMSWKLFVSFWGFIVFLMKFKLVV